MGAFCRERRLLSLGGFCPGGFCPIDPTIICKVRGITLNYKNSLTTNFDTIKDVVINNRDDVKTVRNDFKITSDHKRLLTVHQDKDYRIVFDKRVIMQDYSTRPYGF